MTFLFVCVELAIKCFSFVYLSYQPPLNTSSISQDVYGLTISTTYHYSGHNRSYLTLNCLDWLLPTKITKNKQPWFPSGPYRPKNFNPLIFFLTYGQSLRRIISHRIFLRSSFQFSLHLSVLYNSGIVKLQSGLWRWHHQHTKAT